LSSIKLKEKEKRIENVRDDDYQHLSKKLNNQKSIIQSERTSSHENNSQIIKNIMKDKVSNKKIIKFEDIRNELKK
jgi:hypothetical protein